MLPLVVMVEGSDGRVRRYAFADSPVSIGRSPFSDLQLSELFVSRWEGTLRFDEREITYFSLGSTNPTFVDGRQVVEGEDTPLTPETVVTLGELTLRFARAAVPESDLRRKGKPKPKAEGPETALKTAYLQAGRASQAPAPASLSDLPASRGPAPQVAPPRRTPPGGHHSAASREPAPSGGHHSIASVPPSSGGRPSEHAAVVQPARADQPHADVRLLGRVTVLGVGAPNGQARESVPPSPRQPSLPPAPHAPPPSDNHAAEERRSMPPAAMRTSEAPEADASVRSLQQAYRAARGRLLAALELEMEQLPAAERPGYAERTQRALPQLAREPEFRALLQRHGVPTLRSEVPEVAGWLADIARDVLPARLHIDTGMTLERILGLLETLTQSIAEIHDAQDTVRQRWLGRQSRSSVLRSENGRAILAYLLNPQANWSERLLELEQTIRQAVTHELALFQATLEGARMLVDSLSPEALAQAEGIDLQTDAEPSPPGMWQRLRGKDVPEARLWRAFVKAHETLLDSNRYQRVFMGRAFARTYLAAMGQNEASEKKG